MATTCAILQPSYIPWRGVFHQIQKSDVFVFYDDVQYDKHGWRNRNRIKTPRGSRWITIPVLSRGVVPNHTPINQILINPNENWRRKHWTALKHNYSRAPYFPHYAPLVESFYCRSPRLLADFTIEITAALARKLGIQKTEFARSSRMNLEGRKTDRLLQVLQQVGATHYISGPAAKAYLEEEKLEAAGISLEYMVYDYPEYPQLYPPFDPYVSILDLLFMTGPDAPKYIWETDGSL